MVFTRCRCLLSNCTWAAVSWLLDASWAPLEASWAALGRLLEPTWSVLGASWSLLGASWSQLGASWAPLGANLEPLGRLLGASWSLLGTSWAPLGCLGRLLAQLGAFWEPQGLHLALPTGLLLYFICTAQGAAKFNNTSFVVPQGLPSATEEHCQRSSSSPDGDICNTSITI